MIIVLQITDLLFKYASQEPMYISKYFMETTREVCQYYWKKVGDVILYVHINSVPKNKPEKTYGTRKLKPKFDHKIYSHQRLEREM